MLTQSILSVPLNYKLKLKELAACLLLTHVAGYMYWSGLCNQNADSGCLYSVLFDHTAVKSAVL